MGRAKVSIQEILQRPQELVEDIFQSWDNITIVYLQNLYNSMKERFCKVYGTKGGPTDY